MIIIFEKLLEKGSDSVTSYKRECKVSGVIKNCPIMRC